MWSLRRRVLPVSVLQPAFQLRVSFVRLCYKTKETRLKLKRGTKTLYNSCIILVNVRVSVTISIMCGITRILTCLLLDKSKIQLCSTVTLLLTTNSIIVSFNTVLVHLLCSSIKYWFMYCVIQLSIC